ncbi:MAG TPA: vanadium-dependent haloperoxidase [Thermoanaerobaculia bacterium]|nr:vanadium-dependent haloperoxidase [Thermoanaerobaculia bacterium]
MLLASRVDAVPGQQPGDDAVLLWNQALLQAVRDTKPGPTVVARAVAVAHTCMYDAWSAYDPVAVPTRFHPRWRRPSAERTPDAKAEAVSYAAWIALRDLFPSETALFDGLLSQQGYTSISALSVPASVGTTAANAVLAFRHHDGSNQLGDLAPGAYADYTGYVPANPPEPAAVADPNRWQPLQVSDGNGGFVIQKYTTPQWGLVLPFALASGDELRPPAPVTYPSDAYLEQAQELIDFSANLTDEQKATAEYFADGPSSEFPPGHWCLFAISTSRRLGYTLDQDVRMFFAVGNALLDASIAAWDAKRAYDSVRPVTAIHYLYTIGMLGEIEAWGGPCAGTQTIPASLWRPYQLSTVVTPPFPEFFSGHSVFSAAAAEVLRSFTGSDTLDVSYVIPAGTFRGEPGCGPKDDVVLVFPTFSSAADAAGMSRRWGGIHFRDGDLTGRATGRVVGAKVWAKAQTYFDGTAPESRPILAVPAPTPALVGPRS